jgi:hypothetical protein
MIYIVTEEPYHDNSTIIGVFDSLADAQEFAKSLPSRYSGNDDAQWNIEAWEIKGESCLRSWILWDRGRYLPDLAIKDRQWFLDELPDNDIELLLQIW